MVDFKAQIRCAGDSSTLQPAPQGFAWDLPEDGYAERLCISAIAYRVVEIVPQECQGYTCNQRLELRLTLK